MQVGQLTEYARLRGWTVALVVEEIASGSASNRPKQRDLIRAANQRKIDCVLVWKLDRWSRELGTLLTSINELLAVGVAFVSFTETLDFSTPQGRAMVALIGVFATFERELIRERVKAGIDDAKRRGVRFGRPKTLDDGLADRMKALAADGLTHSEIAKRVGVARASVQRFLGPSAAPRGRPRRLQSPDAADVGAGGAVITHGLRNILSRFHTRLGEGITVGAHLSPPPSPRLPAVVRGRVLEAELTEDDPREAWEIEAEEWAAYEKSEEGIRERYSGRNHPLYRSEWGGGEEYHRVLPYLIEKAEILKRGWTEGVIPKLLGKPNFVVRHKHAHPWHFWYRSDVEKWEEAEEFQTALKRSRLAKESKIKSDETKLEKFKNHLESTRLPVPDMPYSTLIRQACTAENKRRRQCKDEYFAWECELSEDSEPEELWYATKRLLHKKMEPHSKQILNDFGVAGLKAARVELNSAMEEAIQRKLLSYGKFPPL
jgi:DNA invertase Pin-like site-specific DNA recombinase